MSHHPRTTLLLASALTIVVAACSGGGASAPPSGGPSSAPSEAPSDAATIGHPTGATDVILQYEEGGGFVMPAFTAASAPHFVLYGDGTLIVRDPAVEAPPAQGSAFVMNPLQTAKLSEDQVQELLAYALGEGGLAAARPEYVNQMIADASTAFFTIDTDEIQKTVAVYALGFEDPANPGPDGPARAAFKKLADRLVGIAAGWAISPTEYAPEAYRVALIESPGAVAPDVRTWPWEGLTLDGFQPSADPDGLQFPHATMTAEQIAALGVTDFEGGFQNLIVTAPDGGAMTYTVAVRPLLPGETE
jgi:hypothetical protein